MSVHVMTEPTERVSSLAELAGLVDRMRDAQRLAAAGDDEAAKAVGALESEVDAATAAVLANDRAS